MIWLSDCADQVLSDGDEVNKEVAQMEVVDETKATKEATETKAKKKKKTKKKSKISPTSLLTIVFLAWFSRNISV